MSGVFVGTNAAFSAYPTIDTVEGASGMKKIVVLGAGLVLWGASGFAQTSSAQTSLPQTGAPTGHWQGRIQIPEHQLGITVDLARSPKGAWIGSITVTGSSSVDVPLTDIMVENAAVRFVANLPERASFDGHLSADGSSLSGTAANAAGDAPFQLARSGEAKVSVPPPSSVLSKEFEGAWEGTLDSDGRVRKIGLRLSPSADGTAIATFIAATERGSLEIPATTVTINGKDLQVELRSVSGTYRGTLGAGGEIVGEWAERANRLALTFKRGSSDLKKP